VIFSHVLYQLSYLGLLEALCSIGLLPGKAASRCHMLKKRRHQ
jgi:hypothetical protein